MDADFNLIQVFFRSIGGDLMKYYEQLVDLGCFTQNDVEALTGNNEAANSLIRSYKAKGLIERVRRDLYVAMSLETKQPVPNRYAIASNAAPDAYVSYHTALEYHGLANQVYYEAYAASQSRFRTFEHDGVTYSHVQSPFDLGVETKMAGVRVTDLERTVLDGINDFSRVGGLEELLRTIEIIPYLDSQKLTDYLSAYDKVFLYQKAGYILEHYKDGLKLTDDFFTACKVKVTKSKRYLYEGAQTKSLVFNKDWMVYVPENLLAITQKGANYIE
jgi:predicted transcriptional regulator of viral defense system